MLCGESPLMLTFSESVVTRRTSDDDPFDSLIVKPLPESMVRKKRLIGINLPPVDPFESIKLTLTELFQKYDETSVTACGGTSVIPGLHPIAPNPSERKSTDIYDLVFTTA